MSPSKSFVSLAALLLCGVMATPASADVIGELSIANSSAGAVIVNATTINWTPDINNVATGGDTALSYTGPAAPLGSGVLGTLKDLTFGEPFPVVDFMTFLGHDALHFDLTQVGPGSANSDCAALDTLGGALIGMSCSPVVALPGGGSFSSPFVLTVGATGTSVTLAVFGTARDDSPNISLWSGAFTTQITGMTPAQIADIIAQGGSISSTHSAEFTAAVIPEPATLLLLGTGLAGAAVRGRKRLS